MQRGTYQVTSEFIVFRQPDKTPTQLIARCRFSALEPLYDTVILEIGSKRFESAKNGIPCEYDHSSDFGGLESECRLGNCWNGGGRKQRSSQPLSMWKAPNMANKPFFRRCKARIKRDNLMWYGSSKTLLESIVRQLKADTPIDNAEWQAHTDVVQACLDEMVEMSEPASARQKGGSVTICSPSRYRQAQSGRAACSVNVNAGS